MTSDQSSASHRFDVSIIIPTHNRADLVRRAVLSCLQQDCRTEVIVVDDGSDEDIAGALQNDPRVAIDLPPSPPEEEQLIYLRQEQQGACVARNMGLQRASGEYVKFLDSDDELLPGVLAEEVSHARSAGCDALLTGWEERTLDDAGYEIQAKARTVPAPDLSNGIDDMLEGRGPWTAAALYRRAFVRDLRWDPDWIKAQDWGWSLTVCLAGARFASLDIASSVYCHHAGERITSQGDSLERSTDARQYFLRMIEDELRKKGQLTDPRRQKLAQYYCRDRQVICLRSPGAWRELWKRCRKLSPGLVPNNAGRVESWFMRVMGPYWGVRSYVHLKGVIALCRKGCRMSVI